MKSVEEFHYKEAHDIWSEKNFEDFDNEIGVNQGRKRVVDCSDSSSDDNCSDKKQNSKKSDRNLNGSGCSSGGGSCVIMATTRKRRSGVSARERNLRRLESNERERMRMHSLNDAFEVCLSTKYLKISRSTKKEFYKIKIGCVVMEIIIWFVAQKITR